MQYKNKIDAISEMRVIAMIMIVLFHSLLFYTGTWWSMGGIIVPLWKKLSKLLDSIDLSMFVFVSGFLFGYLFIYKGKYKDWKQFLYNKYKRLLLPYLLWGCLMILFRPTLNNWMSFFTGISHLWFLLMLFEVFLIAFFILRLWFIHTKSLFSKVALISILYIIWFLFHRYSSHHYFMCIEKTLSYLIPFTIGCYCAEKKIWNYSSKLPLLLLLFSISFLTTYIFFMKKYSFFVEDLVIRCLSYISIICLFIILSNIKLPDYLMKCIIGLEPLCFGIYIFNQMIINELLIVPRMNRWFTIHYQVGPLLLFIISFSLPLILSYIFNRNKKLSWMIGNK